MNRLENSVAIITGPNDRGIGAAIAEKFAEEGAKLCLLGLDRPERLLKRLDRMSSNYIWREVNVTSTREVDEAIQHCRQVFGEIDSLINNAGVEFSRPFEEIDDDEWDQLLAVNLTGAMKMIRAVLPHLKKPGGAIVNISSAMGMSGCAGFHAYSASKAGLIGMTQSLAMEIAPFEQRAVCVAPAMVHTPMVHKHASNLETSLLGQVKREHPLGIGFPQDVANAVCFLASQEARWITGISLPLGWFPSWGVASEQLQTQNEINAEQGAKTSVNLPAHGGSPHQLPVP